MRILKNRYFSRFARQQGIDDTELCDAVYRAEHGLIDADLGGGLIKQRIARPNEGKSGGFRSLVIFRSEVRAVFVYGFPKNERGNIRPDELKAFKLLAGETLVYDEQQIETAIVAGVFTEVKCNEQDVQE